jgi:hypothetical protein
MTATLRTAGQIAYPEMELGRILPNEAAQATAAKTAKNVALLAVAPFIGLAYAVLMPFFGIAMIARIGYQAYKAPKQAA